MKNRMWWLIAAGIVLMGLGMLGSGAFLAAGRGNANPSADLIGVTAQTGSTSAAMTLDDISAIQAAMEGSKLSWWANGKGSIGTDTRNTQADVYAVTGAFQDFHQMDMLYGSFLPRTEAGGMAAVLDSNLAYRIFGTENAVGMEVKYQGKTFEVCGVVKADGSILGLMSGNGLYRAYVSGYDLISTGKLSIGGFEATLPRGAPGQSLAAVKAAMQSQSISTGSYLFEDMAEQLQMDAEIALIPYVLFWVSAALLLLILCIRAARGIGSEALAIIRDDYFRNTWDALLWRFVKLLLTIGAGAGLCWLMWDCIGLKFILPSKYIPGSWIDPTFYTGLIASESQAAIAAQSYTRMWWDLSYDAAVRLSRMLDVLAVLGGIIAALSLRVLLAERKAAPAKDTAGLWDITWLWLLAFVSFGATMLLTTVTGLPLFTGIKGFLVLALGLLAWAALLHSRELETLLYKKIAKDETAVEAAPVQGTQKAYGSGR